MPVSSHRFHSRSSAKKSMKNKMPKSSDEKNQENMIETSAVNKICNDASMVISLVCTNDEQLMNKEGIAEV